jgi:hypothetical protein
MLMSLFGNSVLMRIFEPKAVEVTEDLDIRITRILVICILLQTLAGRPD